MIGIKRASRHARSRFALHARPAPDYLVHVRMQERRMTPAELDSADPGARRRELLVFLFLTLVLMPVLAVLIVATYGFGVWMAQLLIFGPPAG
jgi:nitrate reductase NapE